ncbi:MAG TPA: 50S ribosomal protein L18e [Candidatus Methanomethylophilaceae archaeon]|nr:50S ribosomal protein L18e [Candidatus Methanomethylophilaceae archaeon]
MKASFKTNPSLIALIFDLKATSRENESAIWRDIAVRLEKPHRNWAETNLSKIDRYAEDGETVVIPGKVLAAGNITKKVTIAAYSFSKNAKDAITESGGKAMSLRELMDANPKGSNIRIMR